MDRLYCRRASPLVGANGSLEGNQPDNPINKLTGVHAPRGLVILDLIDRLGTSDSRFRARASSEADDIAAHVGQHSRNLQTDRVVPN